MLLIFFFVRREFVERERERSTNEKDARLRRGGSRQIRFDCASKRALQQLRTYHKQRGPFMAPRSSNLYLSRHLAFNLRDFTS